MCQVKITQNKHAKGPGETWKCSFNTKPQGIWGPAGLCWIYFLMGIKINWVRGKKSQSNLDLIGPNEINIQLNETNIVNQFEREIKFSAVVPGETLCQAVVRTCTNTVKWRGWYNRFMCQTQTKMTLCSHLKWVNGLNSKYECWDDHCLYTKSQIGWRFLFFVFCIKKVLWGMW